MRQVSLVIPAYNEERSIGALLASIAAQRRLPDEVIVIDAGSADQTVQVVLNCGELADRISVISIGPANPGTARNAGVAIAEGSWIAFADCGTVLAPDWLEQLLARAANDTDIVFGNFDPVLGTWFEQVAALAYVPASPNSTKIRSPSIASCLVRTETFKRIGGFPPFRAAEDLHFFDKMREGGYQAAEAPEARVYWQLAPDLRSTFARFASYSYHNLIAKRGWDWHWGVARQYMAVTLLTSLAVLSPVFWVVPPLWLAARVGRTLQRKRHGFDIETPLGLDKWVGVAVVLVVLDAATLTGFVRFVLRRKDVRTT